jgi:hypothetical protein
VSLKSPESLVKPLAFGGLVIMGLFHRGLHLAMKFLHGAKLLAPLFFVVADKLPQSRDFAKV